MGTLAMSDRSSPRRAALRAALRGGDILATARAWERLRADPSGITRDQLLAARTARLALGRAIRNARWRRTQGIAPAREIAAAAAPTTARVRVRRALLVALAVGLVLAGIGLWPREAPEGFAPAAAPPETQQRATQAFSGGRGRSSATLPPIVAASPTAEPTPTAPPSDAPGSGAPGTPGPSGVPGGIPGGVPGGTPGGVVGGVPGGTGNATPTPAPVPTPSPTPDVRVVPEGTPPPRQPGWDRITFHVFDSATRFPLPGVCVSYGTACGPDDYHTNSLGYYWLDLQPPAASLWSFRFVFDGYFTAQTQIRYERGQSRNVDIYLRRR